MTAQRTQNALFVTQLGMPVTTGIREIPTPGPDEVLIKVTATQILPHDTYSRDKGLFISDHLPAILGGNIAGIVVSSSSSRYTPGQHIYGGGSPLALIPNYSGLQEYALLAISNSSPVPAGISDDEAATLPINTITSFAALFHPKWLGFPTPWSLEAKTYNYSAQKLVILGAGTNVGRLAVQFAKFVGIGTIVVTASLSHEEELLEMGTTQVLDRHLPQDELVSKIHEIVSGQEEVTRVYDCASWTFELAASLLAKNKEAKIATLHRPGDDQKKLVEQGNEKAKIDILRVVVNNWGEEDTEKFWEWIGSGVRDGWIRIPKYRVIEGLDADKVNEALDSYSDGKQVTQAVVHPHRHA